MVRDVLDGHHVLVVDDDERLLALARLALQKQGVRVSTAATAEEGRKLIGADPPDLVILDIVLPDMSGWEVLRRIRETDNCLVMLLSGRDSDIDKARGLDLGADDYLTKPFSFLEFEARVRALLRRAPVRKHAGGEHAGGEHVSGTDGRPTLLDGAETRHSQTELCQPMGMVAAGPALHAELVVALVASPKPVRQGPPSVHRRPGQIRRAL
jgi:DNA-binding response OmpR family regulator